MPLGLKPKCTMCKTTASPMWRKSEEDEVICNSCATRSTSANSSTKTNDSSCSFTLRKSTRAKSSKFKQQVSSKNSNPKGKGRRSIFKKSCHKAPTSVATPVTSQTMFYRGTYFQVGDIVSVVDVKGGVYYCQLRGLLQDQYCEKSAVVTWLLPTQCSPKGRFDPATYIIGPEEDIPRKLECFEFVCHAPSEYYQAKVSPYPPVPHKPESGFVWTRVGPRIVPLPSQEEVFGTN